MSVSDSASVSNKSAQAGPESRIFRGFVRHRRLAPVRHEFRYPLFMAWLKLEEIDHLSASLPWFGTGFWHWARFRRQDYLGPQSIPLQQAVLEKLGQLLGSPTPVGEVYMLGQLRFLGIYFSPLNLYFVRQAGVFRYLLAEVSNTPWNERHYYALDLEHRLAHDKAFHVSPFNPMAQRYHWIVRPPTTSNSRCMVHLQVSHQEEPDLVVFDATMVLKPQPLNRSGLLSVLLKSPAQGFSMMTKIYWQAIKLFLKGVPFHPHPRTAGNEYRQIKYRATKSREL